MITQTKDTLAEMTPDKALDLLKTGNRRFVENKRELASRYQEFFESLDIQFIHEPEHARSNYWLNAVIMPDRKTRDEFLTATNEEGVMTRPIWKLLNKLDMYKDCQTDALINAQWLEDRVVNIPSSVIDVGDMIK